MLTSNALSIKSPITIFQFLDEILFDEYELYIKTKTAFWNFEHNNLSDKNKIFEIQYIEINSLVDKIAKRIKALDSFVSLPVNLKFSKKKEKARISKAQTIQVLVEKHQEIIEKLKSRIDAKKVDSKAGTNELICSLILKHEEILKRF